MLCVSLSLTSFADAGWRAAISFASSHSILASESVSEQALSAKLLWVLSGAREPRHELREGMPVRQRQPLWPWFLRTFQRGKAGYEEWLEHPGSRSILYAGIFSAAMNFVVKLALVNIHSTLLLGVLYWVPFALIYGLHDAREQWRGHMERPDEKQTVRPWRKGDTVLLSGTVFLGALGQSLYFYVLGHMSPWVFSFLLVVYPYTSLKMSRRLFKEHIMENGQKNAAWLRAMHVFYLCFAALGLHFFWGIWNGDGSTRLTSWPYIAAAILVGICSAFFQIGQKGLTNPEDRGGRGVFLPARRFTVLSGGITATLLWVQLLVFDPQALWILREHRAWISALVISTLGMLRLLWSAHNTKAVRTEPLSVVAVAQLLSQQTHAGINFVGNLLNQLVKMPELMASGTIEPWTISDFPSWLLTFVAVNEFFDIKFWHRPLKAKAVLLATPEPPLKEAFDLRGYLHQKIPPMQWPAWEGPVQKLEDGLQALGRTRGAETEQICRQLIGVLVKALPLESPPGRQRIVNAKSMIFDEEQHGWLHSLVVIPDALDFSADEAQRLNHSLSHDDITELAGAGFIHDLSAGIKGGRDQHHRVAAQLARAILSKAVWPTFNGHGPLRMYSDELVERIAQNCLRHRGRSDEQPQTLLQKAFRDADELAADLERIAALPKDDLFSPYLEVYRAYTLRERSLFGSRGRKFSHATDTHKELLRYLVFTLIRRSDPAGYDTRLAKERVLHQYARHRNTLKTIICRYLAMDALSSADIEKTWALIDRQVIQLEALIRKDPGAREQVATLMALSDIHNGPAIRAELLARVDALAEDVTRRGLWSEYHLPDNEVLERFSTVLRMKEPERSRHPDLVKGLALMDDYLQIPELPLESRLKTAMAQNSDAWIGFTYALLKVCKDWIGDLFEMTIPPGSAVLPVKGSNRTIKKLGEALAIHFVRLSHNMPAEKAADLIWRELDRLWSPTLAYRIQDRSRVLPMPLHRLFASAA